MIRAKGQGGILNLIQLVAWVSSGDHLEYGKLNTHLRSIMSLRWKGALLNISELGNELWLRHISD